MHYSRGTKIAIGLAPLASILYSFGSMFWWMQTPLIGFESASDPSVAFSQMMSRMMPMQAIGLLVTIPVMALYIYLAAAKVEAEGNQRLVWILVILFGGYIGQLVFFFLRVWPEPDKLEMDRRRSLAFQQRSQVMQGWYYAAKVGYVGPVSETALRGLIREGDLESDALIWTQGMDGWQQADVVLPVLDSA